MTTSPSRQTSMRRSSSTEPPPPQQPLQHKSKRVPLAALEPHRDRDRGSDPRQPNSDDSISAYIHATSSPSEVHAQARPCAAPISGSNNSRAVSIVAKVTSSPLPCRETAANIEASPCDATTLIRTPQSPQSLEGEDEEEDVAAASGMLSLRGSQSTPPGLSGPIARLPWTDAFASPSSFQRPANISPFVVHCDEDDSELHDENASSSAFRLLRDGAQPDAVLFTDALSQTSQPFSQGDLSRTHSLPWQSAQDASRAQISQGTAGDQDRSHDDPAQADATTNETQTEDTSISLTQEGTDVEDASSKKRRRRTKKEEADVLASVYVQTAFPDSAARQRLADQLGMTTRAVSIWFQNRRQAERKRASRFASTDTPALSAASSLPRSRSDNVTSIIAAAAASASDSKMRRWPPSLDDVASTQRRSPESDDDRSRVLPDPVDGATTAPSAPTPVEIPAPEGQETEEDKENRPTSASMEQKLQTHGDRVLNQTPRPPLKDIRDLVFGKTSLPPLSRLGGAADDEPNTSAFRPDTVNASKTLVDQAPNASRGPFAPSVSANCSQRLRFSMDQVISRSSSTTGIERAQRRRASSSFKRFKSFCISKGGRACIDGLLSPPRKRGFIKSLSMSMCLPPAVARIVSARCETSAEHETADGDAYDSLLEEAASRCQQRHNLLAKMSNSSTDVSSESCRDFPTADAMEEDEERTLRLAANRRFAKAQAKGQDCILPRSNALGDLMSRPWARSVSGPASQDRISMPSLDVAANRDRSRPNPHAVASSRLPLTHATRKNTTSQLPVPHDKDEGNGVLSTLLTNKERKRRSGEGDKSVEKNKKKRLSNADTGATGNEENVSPAQLRGSSSGTSMLPTFGSPRDGTVSRRPFGRSISAQTAHQSSGVNQTPLNRTIVHPTLLYASTPLPSSLARRQQQQVGRASIGTRSGSMNAPSLSADSGSGGRDMTPRSLAFTLGLTHAGGYGNSTVPHHTPYGAAMQTPFGSGSAGSSIYGSRYLPSSSRDIRTSQSGTNMINSRIATAWSPLGKGQDEASMIGATPHLRGEKHARAGSAKASKSNAIKFAEVTAQRMPFARIHSQSSVPLPPAFDAPNDKDRRDLPSLASSLKSSSEVLADASMAAPSPLRRSSRSSPRKGVPGLLVPITPKGGEDKGLHIWSNMDDSGYVNGEDEVDELIDDVGGEESGVYEMQRRTAKGLKDVIGQKGTESPTKVQQRQRQEDAAQVLLGLAGEGR